ncbi:hypothetical protein C5E10_18085 [Pseudoclavibacter sp. RFBG4]|nr:hypothetical protein C5E10_18085 [Pseudoclavibacter sp. RFBG4]
MTPEEKRERDRRRKAAQRANKRNAAGPDATVTFISSAPDAPSKGGTQGGTSAVPPSKMPPPPQGIPDTTLAAVDAQLAELAIPASALLLATQARMFAAALDDVTRVPQWGSLSDSLRRVMEALEKATQAGSTDPLTAQRRAFYSGKVYASGDEDEGKAKRA